MEYSELGLNRFGKKADQSVSTEGAVSSAANLNDNVQTSLRDKNGVDNGKEDAKNIITGTVIVSCIVKTSDGPSRVELSGNDIQLYDDSRGGNNNISGDTSTISFIRSDKKPGKFILQKRHGKDYDADNVMEMFYTKGTPRRFNYLYTGRRGTDEEYNLNYYEIIGESISENGFNPANGNVGFRMSRDGVPYLNSGIVLFDTNAAIADKNGTIATLFAEGDDGGIILGWIPAGSPQGTLPTYYITIDSAGITMNPSPTGAYRGRVASDGTAGSGFPSGWTASRTTTGTYRVTHNLGSGVYVAVVSLNSTQDLTFYVAQNANYFTVYIRDLSSSLTDESFSFILNP